VKVRHYRAVGWVVLSAAAFALTAVAMRRVTQDLHPFQAVFLLSVTGALVTLPWVLFRGGARVWTTHVRAYALRAVFEFMVMTCLFLAFSKLPLAQVATLSFTLPLFGLLGAGLFLHEQIGGRRWKAVVLGFVGVLVVLRPGLDTVSPYALFALLAAAAAAGSMLVMRRLALTEGAALIVFYMAVLVAPLSVVPSMAVWQWPSISGYGWVVVVAVLSILAHGSLARSLALAEASLIMPWKYLQLLFVVLLGYCVYGERVDQWTCTGAALIVGAVLWVTQGERPARTMSTLAVGKGPRGNGQRAEEKVLFEDTRVGEPFSSHNSGEACESSDSGTVRSA
jgi:drug/metabolite transporter (DMT)-like permease